MHERRASKHWNLAEAMLPDFPHIKENFAEAIKRYYHHLVRSDPLLSRIREKRYFEGRGSTTVSMDGHKDTSDYRQIAGEIRVSREEIIGKGHLVFLEQARGTAEALQRQVAAVFFENMDKITAMTGNIVRGEGQPLNFELYLKGLETICIDFDEEGNPRLPTLVASPEMGKLLEDKFAEWDANPEYRRRHRELIERKRQEWLDRESHRKLVD